MKKQKIFIITLFFLIFFLLVTTNKFISGPLCAIVMFIGILPSILLLLIFSFLIRPILGDVIPPHKDLGEMEMMTSGFAFFFYIGIVFLSLIFYFFLNRKIRTVKLWRKIIINLVIAIFLLVVIQNIVRINEIPPVYSALSWIL